MKKTKIKIQLNFSAEESGAEKLIVVRPFNWWISFIKLTGSWL